MEGGGEMGNDESIHVIRDEIEMMEVSLLIQHSNGRQGGTKNIEFPIACPYCGSVHFKMHGVRGPESFLLELRCVRCGGILEKIRGSEEGFKSVCKTV